MPKETNEILAYLGFVFSTKGMSEQPMVDDDPLYANPIKKTKVQVKSDMQTSGRKGKSATGRGKNSRKCWNY